VVDETEGVPLGVPDTLALPVEDEDGDDDDVGEEEDVGESLIGVVGVPVLVPDSDGELVPVGDGEPVGVTDPVGVPDGDSVPVPVGVSELETLGEGVTDEVEVSELDCVCEEVPVPVTVVV